MVFKVLYENKEYDIEEFIDLHPGGREVLKELENKDIKEQFEEVGHSKNARKILEKYRIKNVDTEQPVNDTLDNTVDNTLVNTSIKNEKDNVKELVAQKLFTKEDKYNIHKTFGLLAILSFIYRYFYVLPMTFSLGFETYSLINIITLLIHFILTTSSLIFVVLEHRLLKNPLIIYKEYRLHSIAFTSIAIGVSLIGMTPITFMSPTVFLNIFMLIMRFIVDDITRKYGTEGNTAVRADGKQHHLKNILLGFSFYQFLVTGSCLIYDKYTCNIGYNALIAIQSSTFLMTLKKKGLIRWKTYMIFYGICLVLSTMYMLYTRSIYIIFMIFLCFLVRINNIINNKYIIWGIYSIIVNI